MQADGPLQKSHPCGCRYRCQQRCWHRYIHCQHHRRFHCPSLSLSRIAQDFAAANLLGGQLGPTEVASPPPSERSRPPSHRPCDGRWMSRKRLRRQLCHGHGHGHDHGHGHARCRRHPQSAGRRTLGGQRWRRCDAQQLRSAQRHPRQGCWKRLLRWMHLLQVKMQQRTLEAGWSVRLPANRHCPSGRQRTRAGRWRR